MNYGVLVMSKIKITEKKIIVELAVNIFRERNHFVADCPALELCTQGKTIKDAAGNFKEAEQWLLEGIDMLVINSELGLMGQIIKTNLGMLKKIIDDSRYSSK